MTTVLSRTVTPPEPPDHLAVGRPRRATSGRAVAGGFLLAVAVVAVFGAWLQSGAGPGRPYVVATHELAPGARVGAGDLTVRSLRLPDELAARTFASPAAVVGATLAGPLGSGELVQASALIGRGGDDGRRPVTVNVDDPGVALLQPGQSVDVLVTAGTGASTHTSVVVAGARLARVLRATASLSGRGGDAVTLGVTSLDDVLAVVNASRTGQVSVVAARPGDGASALVPGP